MKNMLKIGATVLALLMFTACALGQAPVLRQYYTTNTTPVISSGITVLARVEAQNATNSLYNVLPHLGGFNTWGDNNVFNSGVEFNGTFASILGGVFGEAAKYSSNIFQIKGSGNYFNVATDGTLWGGAARFGSSVWGNNMRSTNAFYIDNAKITAAGNKIVAESGFQGDGQSITLNSAGFVGNLNSGDNTLQEIAQKLDSLTVPGLPTGVITQNQTSVTLGEPFLLKYPSGGPYYWQFDILSGGGHSLEISQIDSGSRVVFNDSGGITASGGFAGDGASVTNVDGANIQLGTINSNKLDTATRALLGGDVTAAMLLAATNTTYQDSTNWSKDGTHITTGLINPNRLGTGSSITTKFLKGDGTWASISGAAYDGTGVDDIFVRQLINTINGNSYIYFGQDYGDGTGTTTIGGSDGIHMNHLVTFEAGATMDGTVYIADMTNTVQKVSQQYHPYTNAPAAFDANGKLTAGAGGSGHTNINENASALFIKTNAFVTNGLFVVSSPGQTLSQASIGSLSPTGGTNILELLFNSVKLGWLGTNGIWYGNGSGLTNVSATASSTNVSVSTGVLSPTSQATNYTLPLLTGSGADTLVIYSANTNLFVTFTGTNNAFAHRTLIVDSLSNTVSPVFIRFASATKTNLNFVNALTNGQIKVFSFDTYDTRGTNVIVMDGGVNRGNFTQ